MKRDRCKKCHRARRGPLYCDYHSVKCDQCGKKSSFDLCRVCKSSNFRKSLSHWKKNPVVVKTKTSVIDDIAILGGHFQGDGCIHSSQWMISVISVNREIVDLFQKKFGGSIKYDCGAHRWRLCGKDKVVYSLSLMKPYIWNKTEQLEQICSVGTINDDLVVDMKRLKTCPPPILLPQALSVSQEDVYKVIAGFLGADGCITLALPKCSPTVDFGQKHREMLDTITHFFPGPNVLGPYESKRNGTVCTSYRLRYRGRNAISMLKILYQYISCEYKIEIAKTILENQNNLRTEKVAKRVFGLLENGKSRHNKIYEKNHFID